MYNENLLISQEVKAALDAHAPVIALESTIISHGMPYPQNVETARECEKLARENGATPATCAILGGKLCIGLDDAQLEYLGKAGSKVAKVSRRDIPVIVSRKGDGATTVAATMILAAMAGIQVFATGGIGGVHRGAEVTMDISADLEELAQTPVTVVCAGAKSILDLGLTLEYLETKGVPVIGFGTDELPAFYTRKSGFKLNCRMDTPKEMANAIAAAHSLGYKGGMLVVNPIPEAYSMDKAYIDSVIKDALSACAAQGVKGKDITPFLLARIAEETKGSSLNANIQLVYNNVQLAAKIASEV